MKKLFAIALALVLAFSAYASALTISGPNEYPIVDEKVTLKVMALMRNNVSDMYANVMTQRFEELTNVHIEWEWYTGFDTYSTKMNLSLASQEYPDIYWGVSLTPAQIMVYANQGIFVPIDGYIDDYMPNFKAMLDADSTIKNALTAPDGHIYSLARTDAGLHMITPQKMFINTDWLAQAGMDMPETTEEFRDFLIYVRDNDMNGDGDTTDEVPLVGSPEDYGGFTMLPTAFLLSSWELQPDSRINIGEDDTLYLSTTTENYREGLRYVKSLYDDGLLAKDTFTMSVSQECALTSDPEHLEVACAPGFVGTVFFGFKGLDADTNAHMREIYASVLPLANDEGVRQCVGVDSNCELNTFVTSACKYPEIALKWMDYWYSEMGTIESKFGWENEHWEWSENLSMLGENKSLHKYKDDSERKLQIEYPDPSNVTWMGSAPRYDTLFTTYCEEADPTAHAMDYYRDSIGYLDFFPEKWLPQTLWMSEEQANELGLIETMLMDYIANAEAEFIIGKRDIENDWDAYQQELLNLGSARYLAIYQEIYDNILANQ